MDASPETRSAPSRDAGERLERGGAGAARRPAEHWVLLGAGLLVPVALLLAAFLLEPDARGYGTHEQLGIRPCTTMALWGVPCPGCGVTTSVAHAVRGELGAALATQPFGLVAALVGVAFSAWSVALHLRGRDLSASLRKLRLARWGVVLALLLLASWAYKLAAG